MHYPLEESNKGHKMNTYTVNVFPLKHYEVDPI